MNLLIDAFIWLTSPENWTGAGGIPVRIGQHLGITLLVLFFSALVALPAGVLVGHFRRGRIAIVAIAGAARAIPTLGLLTLLGLMLGIGFEAPTIALVVLAIPSLLAGAYAGVEAVSGNAVDASRSVGMTEWQIITQVELPLAAPVIVGGIRAATLQVIATATLAAYISDIGLGRYLFAGLKSRDYGEMLGGALLVAIIAITLEIILAAIQRATRRAAAPSARTSQMTASPSPH